MRYSTLLPILLILSPLCASLQFYIAPSPDLCPGGQVTTANGQRPSGAVFLDGLESLEITSSNFERNRAYSGCGALDIKEAFMSVIRLSKFVNNSDGAVCISLTKFTSQGSVVIIESTFIGHVGRSALSLTNRHEGNDMSVSNSVFAHNNASGFGGAIILDGGPLTISRSNFTSNSASGIGGALCVRRSNVVVNDSSFVGNTAVAVYSTESRYQDGGAVVVQYGNFTTYRTEFIDNTGSNGGGIHVYTGNIFVHNSTFKRNTAKGVGGAIAACACRRAANITITDSRLSWNTADSQCGAVHFLGVQSVNLISGSIFSNNGKLSTRSGGAACAKGVTLSILNSKFRRNLALLEGGVFFVSSHSRVSVSDSKFDHNVVEYRLHMNTLMEVEECLILNVEADFKLMKAPSQTTMQSKGVFLVWIAQA